MRGRRATVMVLVKSRLFGPLAPGGNAGAFFFWPPRLTTAFALVDHSPIHLLPLRSA